MAKSTISASIPTIGLRNQVASDTSLPQGVGPKSRIAGKDRNLRAGLPFDRVVLAAAGRRRAWRLPGGRL